MQRKGALIFLVSLLIVLLPFLLQVAWLFLAPFVLASVLAIMLNPIKEWLRRRTRRPGLASFLTTFTTIFLIVIFLAMAGIRLTEELTNAYVALSRQSLEEGGWPALAAKTTERVVDALATRLPIDKEEIRTEIMNRMKEASAYLLNNVGVAVNGVTTVGITCLLVTFFLYFLLRYGSIWIAWLADFTPLDDRAKANIIHAIRDSVLANLSGMFAVAIGQGLLLSLGFWFLGLQSPMLWGAIGGLASIIPVVGALLIWAPVAIAYLIAGTYWKALLLVLWGLLVVGSVDNVVRPWVVGKRNKQHPMLIALSAIGGTYAFGAMGILLGPLLVSLFAAVIKEIQQLIPPNSIAAESAVQPPGAAGSE
jgi:predicted PurR-regulated permease PerM